MVDDALPIFVTFTMDCERIAERSPTGGPVDWGQSERAIRGFADVLDRHDLVATLFITPETAGAHTQMFFELEQRGHELGMHLQSGLSLVPATLARVHERVDGNSP